MAKLLLNLRMVLEDEVEDIREMLESAGIEYYETQPSRWGISHGGIWLRDDDDLTEAKRLMAAYQARRRVRVREENEQARREGTAETFADVWRQRPGQVLLNVVAIIILLLLVALPVILLRG